MYRDEPGTPIDMTTPRDAAVGWDEDDEVSVAEVGKDDAGDKQSEDSDPDD